MRAAVTVVLLAATALAFVQAVRTGTLALPDHWNPWAPLRVEEPLHWLTRHKLARLSADDALCMSVLQESAFRYQSVPDHAAAGGCGYRNAVRVHATSASVQQPFILRCRTAVSLALWEHHVVQPAAHAHFGARIARLEHFGSYACRNVYGRRDAPLSRHATADALDVSAFVLTSGRRVSVLREWSGDDAAARFLQEVHRGACRVFDGVLGPEYNIAHRDHFHLDRGGYRMCR